jgi:CDGSH-type Zn-finger protein/uncharacterized membrane protein YozB (DUF420 family)
MALMDSKPKIACTPNGPYYLLNDMEATPVPNLRRASGEACATVRGVALCRCGGSKNKPFCDGTHWAIRFDEGRGRQAGMFAPPLGLRRSSFMLGGLLVAGAAAAILAIEAGGKWSAPGFLGPGGLVPDLNLALELLLVGGLTWGYWLARRGNIAAHRYNQTIWVLVNTVLVALIMARGMENAALETASDLARPHLLVPWLHALLGAATVAAGLWLVLQMNGILPRALHVRGWKTLMRVTLAGYWAVAALGLALYYLWFMR